MSCISAGASQVMYVKGAGNEDKVVVLADDEYNEIEIPLARFIGYSTVNEGATAVLYKDDEEIVKIVVKWGHPQDIWIYIYIYIWVRTPANYEPEWTIMNYKCLDCQKTNSDPAQSLGRIWYPNFRAADKNHRHCPIQPDGWLIPVLDSWDPSAQRWEEKFGIGNSSAGDPLRSCCCHFCLKNAVNMQRLAADLVMGAAAFECRLIL